MAEEQTSREHKSRAQSVLELLANAVTDMLLMYGPRSSQYNFAKDNYERAKKEYRETGQASYLGPPEK